MVDTAYDLGEPEKIVEALSDKRKMKKSKVVEKIETTLKKSPQGQLSMTTSAGIVLLGGVLFYGVAGESVIQF